MTAPPDALVKLRERVQLHRMKFHNAGVNFNLGAWAREADDLMHALLAQVERSEQETKQEREGRLVALAELAGSRLLRMEWQEKATKLEQARDAAQAALTWVKHYYGEAMQEQGCPCETLLSGTVKRCPLHAAHPSLAEGDDTGDGGTPLQQPR